MKLIRLFNRTHERVDGRNRKMTKRRKIALGRKIIDDVFEGEIDFEQDAVNQIKLIDRGS